MTAPETASMVIGPRAGAGPNADASPAVRVGNTDAPGACATSGALATSCNLRGFYRLNAFDPRYCHVCCGSQNSGLVQCASCGYHALNTLPAGLLEKGQGVNVSLAIGMLIQNL